MREVGWALSDKKAGERRAAAPPGLASQYVILCKPIGFSHGAPKKRTAWALKASQYIYYTLQRPSESIKRGAECLKSEVCTAIPAADSCSLRIVLPRKFCYYLSTERKVSWIHGEALPYFCGSWHPRFRSKFLSQNAPSFTGYIAQRCVYIESSIQKSNPRCQDPNESRGTNHGRTQDPRRLTLDC